MKIIVVSSASRYARGKGRNRKDFAQVTFLTGEGSGQRSGTAHPEFRPGVGYVGFNPDPRAVPLNEQYEAELVEAEANLVSAKAKLTRLQEKMLEVENGTAEPTETAMSALDIVIFGDFGTKLAVHIEAAKVEVTKATDAVADAEGELDIVRRDYPLEVEFIGAGLTN